MSDAAPPLFYDLDALCASLGGFDRYKAFADQVRRYRDAMSTVNDLRECTEILDVLQGHETAEDASREADPRRSVVAGALLAQAVIWYVRATKTSSDHRSPVPIAAKMPPELGALHQRMIDLRDRALAHFGPAWGGERPPWVKETAALRVDGDQASVLLLYSRTKFQTDIPAQLRSLLDFALPRAWEIATRRANMALAECKRLYDADEAFADLLRSSTLDVRAFFAGDMNAVRAAMEAPSTAGTLDPPSYWSQEFHPI